MAGDVCPHGRWVMKRRDWQVVSGQLDSARVEERTVACLSALARGWVQGIELQELEAFYHGRLAVGIASLGRGCTNISPAAYPGVEMLTRSILDRFLVFIQP